MNWAGFLLAMVQPMLGRVLLALGFQVVTITGMTAAVNQLKGMALSGLALLQPETLSLFQIAGGPTALGIILGACTTKLALWMLQNQTRILGSNPT